MNRSAGGLEFATQCIVIGELAVVRFGMRVSSGADRLELAPRQSGFILGQVAMANPGRARGFARGKNEYDQSRENG